MNTSEKMGIDNQYSLPIVFGDDQDVVAVLHLDKQGLKALSEAFPATDGFSQECEYVLERVKRLQL